MVLSRRAVFSAAGVRSISASGNLVPVRRLASAVPAGNAGSIPVPSKRVSHTVTSAMNTPVPASNVLLLPGSSTGRIFAIIRKICSSWGRKCSSKNGTPKQEKQMKMDKQGFRAILQKRNLSEDKNRSLDCAGRAFRKRITLPSSVLFFHQATRHVRVALLETLPEADLFQRGKYPWMNQNSLAAYLNANLAAHYYWARVRYGNA